MTLTEQWKKGELQNDWYYIRTTNGIEKWEYIKQSHGFGYYETEWVLEVLAPVPSYEEWQKLVQDYSEKHDSYLRLSQTNHQLRKFLEEFNALDVAEENEALKTKLSIQCEANEELRKENQQLKKLLQEAKDIIEWYKADCGYRDTPTETILARIDNAIG